MTFNFPKYLTEEQTAKYQAFTPLEITVYEALVGYTFDAPFAEMENLVELTNLDVNIIKGVLGSLSKKGMAYCDTENVPKEFGFGYEDVNSFHPAVGLDEDGKTYWMSYGIDVYPREEFIK